jgi:hypothetical protein
MWANLRSLDVIVRLAASAAQAFFHAAVAPSEAQNSDQAGPRGQYPG